mmetsp:Transcript_38605/g.56844  ORF Transcript_38605/g.56844 Transcript_38605/m.56844 type:complete len:144 (-) Transcript_38605:876-1307(-)
MEEIRVCQTRGVRNNDCLSKSNCLSGKGGACDMVFCDATFQPIRDGCTNVCVSDLPFGQKCMSSNKLHIFLPLMISEMARLLQPGKGKIVLLSGGSFKPLVKALSDAGSDVLESPSSIFPVNIGGRTAWVIVKAILWRMEAAS